MTLINIDELKNFTNDYLVDLLDKRFTIDVFEDFKWNDNKSSVNSVTINISKLDKDNSKITFYYDNIKDYFIPFVYQLNYYYSIEYGYNISTYIELGRSFRRNYYINANIEDIINDDIEKVFTKNTKRISPNFISIKIKNYK